MNICVIHGSPRKGNTRYATECFMKALQNYSPVEFTQFYLPKDMPHFCYGCYTCFEKGEDKCPHAEQVQPIVEAIRAAEGLIFTTPVYALAESGAIKALLDHLSYIYISHRPMEEAFSKVAFVLTTTAGAGGKNAIKTISKSLNHWGIKRIQSVSIGLFAKDWKDMPAKKQHKYDKIIQQKAKKFNSILLHREGISTRLYTRFFFNMIRKMLIGFQENHTDRAYWAEKGWLGKKRPY